VRYWLHNGFVNVDSEKMSKSLGNFFTIRDVLQSYHPAALRWFLVSSQYRTPLNYTQRGLDEASDRVYYVYQTLADVAALLAEAGEAGAAASQAAAAAVTPAAAAAVAAAGGADGAGAGSAPEAVGVEVVAAVLAGLVDDLNTPQSVSALSAPLKAINDLLTTKAGRKNPQRCVESLCTRLFSSPLGDRRPAPATLLAFRRMRPHEGLTCHCTIVSTTAQDRGANHCVSYLCCPWTSPPPRTTQAAAAGVIPPRLVCVAGAAGPGCPQQHADCTGGAQAAGTGTCAAE
jgi:hypothetical protein